MYGLQDIIIISLIVTSVRSYPGYWSSSPNLNPVHGLFVKPSGDGSKGDLFVAATEENGVKSQWMVDQPVSFLPGATTQTQGTALPTPYPGFATSLDDSKQKQLTLPSPIPSAPLQYAYVIPVPTNENNPTGYTYAYPVQLNPTNTPASKCEPGSTTPYYPYQYPYQLFYPQMMSAYSNAMSILKDAGLSDDTANSVMARHTSPMWAPSPYAYPMYVMMDPNSWIPNLSTTTPSTPTSSPSSTEEEISET